MDDITWFPPNRTVGNNSQLFQANGDNITSFTIINFTLDPTMNTDDLINFRYHVYRNGARLTHIPTALLDIDGNHTDFTLDFGTNELFVPTNDPLFVGDWILIVDTQGN